MIRDMVKQLVPGFQHESKKSACSSVTRALCNDEDSTNRNKRRKNTE